MSKANRKAKRKGKPKRKAAKPSKAKRNPTKSVSKIAGLMRSIDKLLDV
jgi:hypothetical protein